MSEASKTARAHEAEENLTLFGACFCPYVQRTWIALEYCGVPYHYREVDPYKKPKELLEVSPRGLVPALRLESEPPRAVSESTVIAEFVEELVENEGREGLMPPRSRPYERSKARYMCDQVNRHIVPAFYRYLQAQEHEKQLEGAKDFANGLETLCGLLQKALNEGMVRAAGLWAEDGDLGWVDMTIAPWLLRSRVVLTHYRGWQEPSIPGYRAWLDRVANHPSVHATTSTDELYLDSYARYAENRPMTSQVADAINAGRNLP